jgi:hypothetical protein
MSTEINTQEEKSEVTNTTSANTTSGPVAVQVPTGTTTVVSPGSEGGRGDVSASTIARMMGMATVAEFRVLEGKIDLLAAKVNSITGKMERLASSVASVATGSDLERVDVQVSSLRTALNEAVVKMVDTLEQGIDRLRKPLPPTSSENQKES